MRQRDADGDYHFVDAKKENALNLVPGLKGLPHITPRSDHLKRGDWSIEE
jgi:hypothetical protein